MVIFIALLPLGLLEVSHVDGLPEEFAWVAVPGTIVLGWVFQEQKSRLIPLS